MMNHVMRCTIQSHIPINGATACVADVEIAHDGVQWVAINEIRRVEVEVAVFGDPIVEIRLFTHWVIHNDIQWWR